MAVCFREPRNVITRPYFEKIENLRRVKGFKKTYVFGKGQWLL